MGETVITDYQPYPRSMLKLQRWRSFAVVDFAVGEPLQKILSNFNKLFFLAWFIHRCSCCIIFWTHPASQTAKGSRSAGAYKEKLPFSHFRPRFRYLLVTIDRWQEVIDSRSIHVGSDDDFEWPWNARRERPHFSDVSWNRFTTSDQIHLGNTCRQWCNQYFFQDLNLKIKTNILKLFQSPFGDVY